MHDIYCPFCGLPSYNITSLDDIIENLDNKKNIDFVYNKSNNNWLNNCSILLYNGDVLHNMKQKKSLSNNFSNKKYKNIEIYPYTYVNNETEIFGIFLHTDCYKYIESKINFKFSFKHIPYLLLNSYYKFNDIKYTINSSMKQVFDFVDLGINNHKYIISPLKNGINKKQIDKVINKIKLKKIIKNDNRASPTYPASLLENGYIGFGNNKKIWKVINNKWKIQNTKSDKIQYNKFSNIYTVFNVKDKDVKFYNKKYMYTL